MAEEIRVPQLGESVVEATVTRWLKREGDTVAAGDVLVELETDKVNVELPAEHAGVLEKILRGAGETVGVNEVIALLGAGAPAAASPAPAAASAPPAEQHVPEPAVPAAENGRQKSSPVAEKIAAVNNVDLAQVSGSGPGGKILKGDVEAALRAPVPTPVPVPATPVPAVAPSPPAAAPSTGPNPLADLLQQFQSSDREERVKMSRRRKTIAQRLVEAQHNAAMLTTFNEVDMSAIMEIRKRRRDSFKERHGVGLGFMSFFTRAVIGALKTFPLLNAEIQGDEIVVKKYYDIGIAVSTDEGLVVPVLRDADRRSFADIEKGITELATRARGGKLTLPELLGGTFTITNGGIFGSLLSTPILNAPQVGILGMHKIQERPVALNGEVVIRPMMYLALSYDHRIVDGKDAVQFLVKVKELLEDPETLLLEG